MKTLRYLGPEQLEIQEVPTPKPEKGEVLVRVKGCGICGSDVHGYYGWTGRRIAPMTMGHEFSGEIAELGEGVSGYAPGDQVIVQPIHFCGVCENCQKGLTMLCMNRKFYGVLTVDGAMAEYVAVPEKLLFRIPKHMDCYTGALAEPYAVAYGAVAKAGDLKGKTVLVIGAGMIGACVMQLVKLQQPDKLIVSDLSNARLKNALELGADAVINPREEDYMEALARITDHAMVDVSIECVGVEASANQAIKCLKATGTAVWVGMSQQEMTINMQDIVNNARRVLGSYTYTHKEFGELVDIITAGKLATEKLISKVVSLEEAIEIFPDIHHHPDDYFKVIIDPTL